MTGMTGITRMTRMTRATRVNEYIETPLIVEKVRLIV